MISQTRLRVRNLDSGDAGGFIDSADGFFAVGGERLVGYEVVDVGWGGSGDAGVGDLDVAVFLPHGEGGVGYVPCSFEPGEGWGRDGGVGIGVGG